MKTVEFLFAKFLGRKIPWLTLFVILSTFYLEWYWFLAGGLFMLWFVRPMIIATYHESCTHQFIQARAPWIEVLGFYIGIVWEIQSPDHKYRFHYRHHAFHKDPLRDPTEGRLVRAKNMLVYILGLGPHVDPNFVYETVPDIPKNKIYVFFQKYWLEIWLVTMLAWLVFLPFWTFLAFYIFPQWVSGVLFEFGNYIWHRLNIPDQNWAVILFGSNTWHRLHHNWHDQTKPYYGPGIWPWFNIDFYLQKLLFKPLVK